MEKNTHRPTCPHPNPLPVGEGTRTAFRAITIIVGVTLLVGCAQNKNRIGVLERGEHDYMYIQGSGEKEWYSALELRKIAERYIQEKKIDYPVSAANISIWVYTDKRKMLAEVWFTQTSGQPTLGIEIDRFGRVMRHRMGIGIDRMSASIN